MVRLSEHAVQRFQERLRPALTPGAAEHELYALTATAHTQTLPPAWHVPSRPMDGYLMLGDDAALILQREAAGYVAVTCIVKGTLPPITRTRRNRARSSRTYRTTHKERRPLPGRLAPREPVEIAA